jgi:probable F420-dependent oxidoreductase
MLHRGPFRHHDRSSAQVMAVTSVVLHRGPLRHLDPSSAELVEWAAVAGVTGVTLGYWQDRDPMEAVATARLVDAIGYRDLWIGEMATFDAFALATAVGSTATSVSLTIGPLAVAVRDPAAMAMGVASVAALTGRPVDLAIGTSSPVVVQAWHGQPFVASAVALRDAVEVLRPMLAGGKAGSNGYRLRLPPVAARITVAAFGAGAVRVAGSVADRMVINLCTPDQAASLRGALDEAAHAAGRGRVPLAAWVPAAVDPDAEAIEQLRRAIVPYAGVPGYGEMFTAAGFEPLVAVARGGAHPGEVLAAVPKELVHAVGLVGSLADCHRRIEAYAAAGVDEIVIVPATGGDPAGERTLTALAPTSPPAPT